MTDVNTNFSAAHARIGASTGQDTVATLTMHRMRREIDLKKVFDALGLSTVENTADEAVSMIEELITAYARLGV